MNAVTRRAGEVPATAIPLASDLSNGGWTCPGSAGPSPRRSRVRPGPEPRGVGPRRESHARFGGGVATRPRDRGATDRAAPDVAVAPARGTLDLDPGDALEEAFDPDPWRAGSAAEEGRA